MRLKFLPGLAEKPDPVIDSSRLGWRLCQESLPLWSRQIDVARGQSEEAIVALSSRFGAIVEQLDSALRNMREVSDAQVVAEDMAEGSRHLSHVIDALKAIHSSRNELANSVRDLVTGIQELQKMSADVEDIAFQTNMLALNAAIEAAHAGESGRGFAVVAQEVRALSARARDTGKRIGDSVQRITASLKQTGEENERVAAEDRRAVEASEANIQTVLGRFRERSERFVQLAEQTSRDSESIKGQVCDSLVQLQFQDRVGQILNHVVSGMQQLQDVDDSVPISNADEQARLEAHHEQMAKGYTTEEQRRIHQGVEAQQVEPQEITYF
ncbi:MAG: methyl-accepting chemotaxis protein [Steroidobacteraceae bacterium]